MLQDSLHINIYIFMIFIVNAVLCILRNACVCKHDSVVYAYHKSLMVCHNAVVVCDVNIKHLGMTTQGSIC